MHPNYTIYNTGDVIFWNQNGNAMSVLTSDGLYYGEYEMAPINFLTKAIVQVTRWSIIAIDRFLKM